jgi:C4-dicarboxylate-specific signal transduction histidine kinase
MGELTASLAHELNQPLTAIASNAAAGKRFLAGAPVDREMFEELLTDVFTDARRAGAVIHGIRHFVRKDQERRCSLSLNQVVSEVLQLLHSDLIGRATRIETELAPDLPLIQADPVHMQQVLINLIVNSVEAMGDFPPDRRRIEITTRASNGSVHLAVRDFGIGLPLEDPDKIFTHFFTTKPDGMGMGLAIARSIIEAHGGELEAQNLSDGACLYLSLPVAKNEGASA